MATTCRSSRSTYPRLAISYFVHCYVHDALHPDPPLTLTHELPHKPQLYPLLSSPHLVHRHVLDVFQLPTHNSHGAAVFRAEAVQLADLQSVAGGMQASCSQKDVTAMGPAASELKPLTLLGAGFRLSALRHQLRLCACKHFV